MSNFEELFQNLKEVWEKAQITEEDYQKVAGHGEADSKLLDMVEGLLKEKSELMDQAKEYMDKIEKLMGEK